MKKFIQYSKYAIFLSLLAFFFTSVVLGACNTGTPAKCKNSAGGVNAAYDNQTALQGDALIYLKMFGLTNLSCSGDSDKANAANRAKAIQLAMKRDCNFTGCEDGYFGYDSKTAVASCAKKYCEAKGSGYTKPSLNGDSLSCSDGYELDDKCCKPNTCEKPVLSGSCDSYGSGYNLEGTCCVFDCSQGKNCPDGKLRSTGSCKCICDPNQGCCGVQLNISMPFIGDCIEMTSSNDVNSSDRDGTITVNQLNAFPYLIQGISKILVTLILIFSIIVVIVAGLMMTTGVYEEGNYKEGMKKLRDVVIALILLGTSGLILKLINPSFFGG